jgi:hypothetical protein
MSCFAQTDHLKIIIIRGKTDTQILLFSKTGKAIFSDSLTTFLSTKKQII